MRAPYLMALCLIAATSGTAIAQEENSDADALTDEVMTEDVMEGDATAEPMVDEAMEADVVDETMTDEVMEEETADAPMTDEVMEDEAPSLEDIAAGDPALDVRTNEDGEVDAMVMLSDVLFSFGDATLEPAALDVLSGIAEKLGDVPSIEITGHTDAVGDDAFNLALGQRRADAVREWLIANTALTAEVVSATSAGETDPIAENDTIENRALSRRVEFTLPDEAG